MGTTFAGAPFPAIVQSSKTVHKSLRTRRITLLAIVTAGLAFLNALARADMTLNQHFLASAVCLVTALPFIIHVWTDSSALPFMPVYALIYGAHYGWGIFLDEKFMLPVSGISIPDDLATDCLVLVLGGMVAMLAGFYLPREAGMKFLPRLKVDVSDDAGIRVGISSTVIGLIVFSTRSFFSVRYSALVQFSDQLATLGPCLLFYYYLRGQLNGKRATLFYMSLVMRILMDLASGGVGPILRNSLSFVATYWLAKRKVPWSGMLIIALASIPLFGTKGKFRAEAWAGKDMSTIEQATLWGQLVFEGFQTEQNFYYESYQVTIQRLNQLTTLCAVKELTPAYIPYWGGDSYATLYWSLIPRFLYPEKPTKMLGQDFPHRYGLIGKHDYVTSYNFPQLVELYANFGPWGIWIGMAIIGLLLRVIYHVLSDPAGGATAWLFGAVLMGRLTNIDSDFSIVFGGMALNLAGAALILQLLRAKRIHLPLDVFRFR